MTARSATGPAEDSAAPDRPASSERLVSLAQIREAAGRLQGVTLRTPLVAYGPPERPHFLKAESLQPIGAFKLRGIFTRAKNGDLFFGQQVA